MSERNKKGTYHLGIREHFDSAHCLRGHEGKCAAMHGHRWDIEVTLRGYELNRQGMLIDFIEVKSLLEEIVKSYDHCVLNEIEPFTSINPTAENISREIFSALKPGLPAGVTLASIRVWESPTQWASYEE